jgi:preprotein translocase subunit SecG
MLLYILIGLFVALSICLAVLARAAFRDEALHSHDPVHPSPIRGTH